MTSPRSRAAAAALVTAVVVAFASPLRGAWARDDGPWWLPFAVWLPIVVGLGWLVRERRAS